MLLPVNSGRSPMRKPEPQTHQKRSRRGEMRSAGEDGEMSGRAGFPAGFGYIYLHFNDQPLTNPL